MQYSDFKNMLKTEVFGQDLNYQILKTVIENPQRYIGIFRVTSAKTKLIQNITQSCEIKFGDFIEDILTVCLSDMGYENLSKALGRDEEGNLLSADQVFKNGPNVVLIEQKVRDDHDSTKKRGQYTNFIKKVKKLKMLYPNVMIHGIMWFSDDLLKKNKKYYLEQMQNNTDLTVQLKVFYGKELFLRYFENLNCWNELVEHLTQYRNEECRNILNVPDLDTSIEIRNALLEMRQNEPNLIRKLLSNKDEYIKLRAEFFPTAYNLRDL